MRKARSRRFPGYRVIAAGMFFLLASLLDGFPLGTLLWAQSPDPVTIRIVANVAGLVPLSQVPTPQPTNLGNYVQNITAAIQLGKALYWDMQVGSDGQACGSCHFHAGADNRAKNQISPGLNGGDNVFGNNPFTGFFDFTAFGPNYTLTANDFPFHTLSDPDEHEFHRPSRHQRRRLVAGSVQGRPITGVILLQLHDDGFPVPDPIFQVAGINTRRVEPRNTPTVINAVFNFANFWDGRANMFFNGVNPFGPLDSASAHLREQRRRPRAADRPDPLFQPCLPGRGASLERKRDVLYRPHLSGGGPEADPPATARVPDGAPAGQRPGSSLPGGAERERDGDRATGIENDLRRHDPGRLPAPVLELSPTGQRVQPDGDQLQLLLRARHPVVRIDARLQRVSLRPVHGREQPGPHRQPTPGAGALHRQGRLRRLPHRGGIHRRQRHASRRQSRRCPVSPPP